MLEELDKQISILSESAVRTLSRRKVLVNTLKGLVITASALTLGQLLDLKAAFAQGCSCDDDWTNGSPCSGCPSFPGCPGGCTICTTTQWCGGWCDYSNGQWVSCYGGTCGNGYRICTDCICPNCSNKCSCLSQWICYGCCNPQDVEAEMQRLVASGVALHA